MHTLYKTDSRPPGGHEEAAFQIWSEFFVPIMIDSAYSTRKLLVPTALRHPVVIRRLHVTDD